MNARRLPFDYPRVPPPWLAQWPDGASLRAPFGYGVRQLAARVLAQGGPRDIQWDDGGLAMTVAGQRPSWRLVKGEWRRRCTCGCPNDHCSHVYAASQVFEQIRQAENWFGTTATPAAAPPPTLPEIAPAAAPRRPATTTGPRLDGRHDDLFARAVEIRAGERQVLHVEADLHHEDGVVALRFYLFRNERREMLRLQQVLNLALRCRQSERAPAAWDDRDRRFLAWLSGRIRSRPEIRQNLNVLKLRADEFEAWQGEWADSPGRFIERSTQQPLMQGSHTAGVEVELCAAGEDWVEVRLVVVLPGGRRAPFHEVAARLAGGPGPLLLDGYRLRLDCPLPAGIVGEVFAHKSPRMRWAHVCEHLPALIDDRLDLLCGDLVERQEAPAQLAVTAEAEEAEIVVSLTLDGVPLRLDTLKAPAALRDIGGRFAVVVKTSPHLGAVQRLVKRLPGAPVGPGRLRMPSGREAITQLVALWDGLPEGVSRHASPALAGLLSGPLTLKPQLMAVDGERFVELRHDWVTPDGRQSLTAAEAADAVRGGSTVLRTRAGGWLRLDLAGLASAARDLARSGFDAAGENRLLRPEARQAIGRMQREQGAVLHERGRRCAERLLAEPAPAIPPLPDGLAARLRDYQRTGFDFLADRAAYGVGAILADDMGLGKTVQVLALLEARLEADRRWRGEPAGGGLRRGAVVVCPASVVSVWVNEAAKFCPRLRCRACAGRPAQRGALLENGADWDVLVVNYAVLRMDIESFSRYEFAAVVLDEAQQIKNPESQIAQAVKRLRTPRPLAVTGTPLENRLLDLWSIMDFLNPGFLGDREYFQAAYDTGGRRTELACRITPVLLRRTKEMVAPELPSRTEETLSIDFDEPQRVLYQAELLKARDRIAGRGPMEILAALTRLRQLCCDPRLLKTDAAAPAESAKLATLLDMVCELLGEGHSALVFSQFTSMLALIAEELRGRQLPHFTVTGDTPVPRRAEIVRQFTESAEPAVFLLSLKAAGTGLTLTKADYVFLYDPWWNPAVERQAIDRTHRIGQDKPVIAYRLVAADTVEEKVLDLQREKAELFAQVMADTGAVPRGLSESDLRALLS